MTMTACHLTNCQLTDALPLINIPALREASADPQSASLCRWIPGPQQASDGLTKFKGNGVLSEIMRDGLWSIVEDAAWQKVREAQRVNQREKKSTREGRQSSKSGGAGRAKRSLIPTASVCFCVSISSHCQACHISNDLQPFVVPWRRRGAA